ncbi:guanine nucleotide-binding protein alpha-4 subunit [Acrasis kona]|uniref:Guanine nucleotide-binding protein alpha-4 subunit n=1 Tax=Acrasis kona TaxID=1008807 RepID=A0AAW2Z2C9_9EUKA
MGNTQNCMPLSRRSLDNTIQKQRQTSQIIHRSKVNYDHLVVLLGASGTSKSTFLKQIRIIEDAPQFRDSLSSEKSKKRIRTHVASIVKNLIEECVKYNIDIQEEENRQHAENIMCNEDPSYLLTEIKSLIKDGGVQVAMKKSLPGSVQFGNADQYFFDNVERIMSRDFEPTPTDYLKMTSLRAPCDSVQDVTLSGTKIRFEDVCATKNRSKWRSKIHSMNIIMFFASLTDYTQMSDEDDTKTRMDASIALFHELLDSVNCKIILVLSKSDVLKETLDRTPICAIKDEEAAIDTIKRLYMDGRDDDRSRVFISVCNVTDSENVKVVCKRCTDLLIYGDRNKLSMSK